MAASRPESERPDSSDTSHSSHDSSPPTQPSPAQAAKEEPELRLEPSIPLDGKDEEGERLMEQLGQERRDKEKS